MSVTRRNSGWLLFEGMKKSSKMKLNISKPKNMSFQLKGLSKNPAQLI